MFKEILKCSRKCQLITWDEIKKNRNVRDYSEIINKIDIQDQYIIILRFYITGALNPFFQ